MQPTAREILIHSIAAFILALGCGPLAAQPKSPSAKKGPSNPATDSAAIIKTCKSATALVNLNERGSGTAFCVSKDGYFLTNRHVVESVEIGHSVDLILNSGEKNEKAIKAKVIHRSDDKLVDLALLKSEPVKELTPLSLGDDTELVETASVTAFGFPFGRRLSIERQHFPNITVTVGKVSALRRGDEHVESIQIDGAINPGCSGAPLVNERGKVVGVIYAGVPLSGIAFAVPVTKAKEYLQSPRAVLDIPEIPYSKRDEMQRVTLEIVELTPSKEVTTVELTINPETVMLRTFEMRRNGARYEASLRPFEKPPKPSALRLKVGIGRLVKNISIDDQPIQWGARTLPLSACQLIERRHNMHLVTTIEGDKFAIPLSDLPTVRWSDVSNLNLRQADRIQIAVEDTSNLEIPYEAVVRRANTVVATVNGTFRCTNPPRHASDDYPEEGGIDDPAMDDFTVEALIDGKSTLMVTPGGMWWEHQQNALPGIPDGDRTSVKVNGRKWIMKWHTDSDGNSTSEVLPLKIGGLSHDVQLLSLRDRLDGPHNPQRGGIEVKSDPLGHDPIQITFNDSADGAGLFRVHFRPKTIYHIPAPTGERVQQPTSARWSFDEDKIDRIQDSTGNRHVGRGPTPTIVEGRVGKALALDGGNVNCGNIGDFDRTDAFSLGGWVYLTNTSVLNEIVARMDGRIGYRGYDLIVGDRLFFHLLHDFSTGNGIKVVSAEKLKPFRWYHLFATYDGSGNSNGVRLYVDGVAADFAVEMDRLTETTKVNVPFRIGLRAPESPSPEPMHGRLDEIRLYNRGLTPDEVWALFRSSDPGPSASEPKELRQNLLGAWSFDDTSSGSKQEIRIKNGSGKGGPAITEFAEQNISFETGKFGKAVRLNHRVIQFPDTTGDFERTDAFSYGCWVRRTDKPNQSLFSKLEQRPPYRGWDLMIQNGQPRMSFNSAWDSGGDEPQRALFVVGQITIAPEEWHHVITTYDGSSKASGVTIYLDGKPVPLRIEADLLDGSIRTATPLCLGNRFNDPTGVYDGLIDEAVIYTRCLSTQEVTDLVAGKPPKP
ncbi:LamG-like jellyroll fold domain-containing protein [Schlesneria paludicola]|uniref:LamG-like jellyroll fold domain-containing protein n=1 Tax=Schlesneria paludicola TaxID=360056 RepID=UPI00029AAFC5|nr:LamG-like jellyroll fold domain-containing protein [Schlesneria paludicola]